eukprot:762821-Hanusia_phi.AAC.1
MQTAWSSEQDRKSKVTVSGTFPAGNKYGNGASAPIFPSYPVTSWLHTLLLAALSARRGLPKFRGRLPRLESGFSPSD